MSMEVTNEVLGLLRDAGLDGVLINIEEITEENGHVTYRIRHLGTDDDEAAITGAFRSVLGHNNIRVV
jgi:hypothetical protein